MPGFSPFRRAVVLGTGLIGGSFALALRRFALQIHVAGWDRPDVSREAFERGAVQQAFSGELAEALAGADLVYLALPIGASLDVLPAVASYAAPQALVTDAGSTKEHFTLRVAEVLAKQPRPDLLFLPGHPMAGKEHSGIAHADAELFRDAPYALVAEEPARSDPRAGHFAALVESIGARPIWLGARQHDFAVALSSHLPQLCAVALASFLYDRIDENGLPLTLSGPGLRDSLRLAGSPYSTWRDILLTNREVIAPILDLFARHLLDLRDRLSSRELEASFDAANELHKLLRNL